MWTFCIPPEAQCGQLIGKRQHFPDPSDQLPWVLFPAVLEFENWPEEASSSSAEDSDRHGEIDEGSLVF